MISFPTISKGKNTLNISGSLNFTLIVLGCALALTVGCRQGRDQAAAIDKSITVGRHPRTQTYVYECNDGYGFVARIEGEHQAVIRIEGRACGDTMSDETFEATVTVTLNGKKYRGCGRALH
jgi:uncharacterized membrane protein